MPSVRRTCPATLNALRSRSPRVGCTLGSAIRMTNLSHRDRRSDPAKWAADLGISKEAVDVYLGSDVIDLHIDSFIWHRIFRYDLTKRHGTGLFGARFYGHVDFPRILEAEVTGAIWVITTNPA